MMDLLDLKGIKHYIAHWFYSETFCVIRTQPPGKPKGIYPWSYTKEDGWKKGIHFTTSRPLYNLGEIFDRADNEVLMVEGEKTADAAKLLFPEYVITTWSGGANAANKSDFMPICTRKVILWPDNDIAGMAAMDKLAVRLYHLGCVVRVIDVRKLDKPAAWDLADVVDEDVQKIMSDCIYDFEMPVQKQMPPFPHISSKGNVLNTMENLKHLMDFYKIQARYNIMTHRLEIIRKDCPYSFENALECNIADIASLSVLNAMPKSDVYTWILAIADKQRYSPIKNFIESKRWDGVDRVETFLSTVKSDNQALSNKLIYRWMLGAVAAAYSEDGIALPGVLTFQGKQGVGKTQWFKRLVPVSHDHLIKESLTLDTSNKDSIISCTNCWLGEFGEVDNTFNKSSIASLKSFLTNSKDFYRPAYGRVEKESPRRTAYFASVNRSDFLIDETGNRRWWVIAVTDIDYQHQIDMQQLWAQMKTLLNSGESFWPTEEEKDMITESNYDFESIDPIQELILNKFDWEDRYRNNPMTTTEVLDHLGMLSANNASKAMLNRCAAILRKITGKDRRKSNGKKVFDLPRIKR